jgi:hypothetical protein
MDMPAEWSTTLRSVLHKAEECTKPETDNEH